MLYSYNKLFQIMVWDPWVQITFLGMCFSDTMQCNATKCKAMQWNLFYHAPRSQYLLPKKKSVTKNPEKIWSSNWPPSDPPPPFSHFSSIKKFTPISLLLQNRLWWFVIWISNVTSPSLFFFFVFFWSVHVSSSLWLNVSKVSNI